MIVGLLGGVGAEATAALYTQLVQRTIQGVDREAARYPAIVIWSIPICYAELWQIENEPEDRANVVTALIIDGIRRLQVAGAQVIAMPCNTLHALQPRYSRHSSVPLLSIVDCTVRRIIEELQAKRVGLLGTNTTLASGIYRTPLEAKGVQVVHAREAQQQQVMRIINCILTAAAPAASLKQELLAIIRQLAVPCVILGCTELPLVVQQEDFPDGEVVIVSTIDALADNLIKYIS